MANIEFLEDICTLVKTQREIGCYVLTFEYEEAVVTIRVGFEDAQSQADMIISHMTTLPTKAAHWASEQRKGYGRAALVCLLAWAKNQGFTDIQAVQVQRESEGFWRNLGFVRMENWTNDFAYKPESA